LKTGFKAKSWQLNANSFFYGGEGGRGDSRYNCEKIIFPISIEEILLQLEHKFSNVFVEPASEA